MPRQLPRSLLLTGILAAVWTTQRAVRAFRVPSALTKHVGVAAGGPHRSMASSLRSLLSMRAAVRAEDILKNPKWPEEWFVRPQDLRRQDESSDKSFYTQPRLVYHIDDPAVRALTQYYEEMFPKDAEILDICSSWVSHFPKSYKPKRTVGMGMNAFELSKNTQLNEYVVQDLNVDPKFPFQDSSFDVVTCVVSVDYLTKPLEVVREINRVLRPGGLCIMSISNRCFPSKAISLWLETGDAGHIFLVGSYFHYAGGFEPPEAHDISPNSGRSDPMYIVQARKKGAEQQKDL